MIIYNDNKELETTYTEDFPSNDFLSIKDKNEINLSKRQWFGNPFPNINTNYAAPVNNNNNNNNNDSFNNNNFNKNNNNDSFNSNNLNNNNVNNKSVNNNNNGKNSNNKTKSNNNSNKGSKVMIQNTDCHKISDLLNDFGLDYGWKDTNDCCLFNRITCIDKAGAKTTKTSQDTVITELFFNNIKLNGSIPISLCGLLNLKVLQFVNNTGLTGSIPPCIGGLTQLETLVFLNTPITGEIPKSLSAISSLQHLSLENTKIQSNIPEELTNLSNLVKLYINNNPNVTGNIPKEITKLSKLEMLSFSDSSIEGTLPEDIGKLTSLKTLSVHHTKVGGKIPDSIGNLSNLVTIKFHDTKLSGKLPDSFKNLKNLKVLTLNNTSVEGTLPDDFKSLKFEECSFDKTSICLSSDAIKNDKSAPACMTALPVCNGKAADGGNEDQSNEGGMSLLTYTGIFLGVVIFLGILILIFKKYRNRRMLKQEKRAINYYKNNITEQPQWFGNNNLFNNPIVHNNNLKAYNCAVEQNGDPSVFVKDSYVNRLIDDIEDNKTLKLVSDDISYKNVDDTFVNNRNKNEYNYETDTRSISQKSLDSEKTEIEPNRMYENLGSARLNYNDSIYKINSSSSGSSIPQPPNSDNMVFMGREAQKELKLFQQNNNLSFNDEETKSVKEQLEELEQMASNNYNTSRKSPRNLSKSPRSFKSPKSPKSPKPPKSPKSPSQNYNNYNNNNNINNNNNNNNKNDINTVSTSIDINEKILELKFCSFNGLDINADNFHNSESFDKLETKFIDNKKDKTMDTMESEKEFESESKSGDSNKNKESNLFNFANIPGLQIQEYYNQLHLSMDESKDTNSGWGISNNKSEEEENEGNGFNKMIPSGIFTTNKTSWDTTEEESFFSNENSYRKTEEIKNNDYTKSDYTKNDYTYNESTNTTSINSSALNSKIRNMLGTESMLMAGRNYESQEEDSSGDDGYHSRGDITEDSRYKSGVTDGDGYDYSKYNSGYTTDDKYKSGYTDDKYRSGYTEDDKYRSGYTDDKYRSGYTEDDKYRSGYTDDKYRSGYTEDDKYRSGYTEDDKYRSGYTDDKYKSGFTTDDGGYSRYDSRVTDDPSKFESIDRDRDSKFNSDYNSYTNVVITDVDGKTYSTSTKKTDSTRYTSTTTSSGDTITKDYTLSTGYSSTGYTLSNANTLSSGFTLSSSVKTNSNGSNLSAPKTNSSRTTKTSTNLNIVSTISDNPTDSLFSDLSKLSSINSMGTVSSISFTDNEKD